MTFSANRKAIHLQTKMEIALFTEKILRALSK